MSEDETKKLTDRQLLEQIAARPQRIEDDRARETKPLLGEIRKELADFRAEMAEFREETSSVSLRFSRSM
jgi:hypothetical protein